MPKKIYFLAATLFLGFAATMLTSCQEQHSPIDHIQSLPIQHNGRVKPFEAFSRQAVEFITGKERWEKKAATTVLLEALADREALAKKQWILINNPALINHLNMDTQKHFFSYAELFPVTEKIEVLVREAKKKRDTDQRPTKLEQAAEALYSRIFTVSQLIEGDIIKMVPPLTGYNWESPYLTASASSGQFQNIIRLFGEKKYAEFDEAVHAWEHSIAISPAIDWGKIDAEMFYIGLKPFEWSWIFYLLAFIAFSALQKFPYHKTLGVALALGAFFFHTLGLGLRCYVLSRPPVSNMYESMIFMNWALMFFAFIFASILKNRIFLTAGSAISALVMIYANLLPIDANLDVLVPVLRSNYWLTIHVLTIVSSYGAFGLAMALGHRHLWLSVTESFSSKKNEHASAELIYRVIQLGVLLIGIGTTLGGVWANESWGRFWGWDPKETWALITFLGYLVVIHLRYAKKITDFYLALSSVLGFLLVLMTWYGVNFVLGRGLHSYGAGTGGMSWVIYYLIFEAVFVGFILFKKNTLTSS